MKTLTRLAKLALTVTIKLPLAALLLGVTAIVNPSRARKVLKSAIRSANEKTGNAILADYAAK